MTHLLLVGISHHTAPVELRELVDFTRRGLAPALSAISERPATGEVVVLSTCNRSEIYATCSDPDEARRALGAFMSEFHGVAPAELSPHLYSRTGVEAARHLFRVAAGLDSLVVGEPQILGQVKDAYEVATEQHATGAVLNRLFHRAFAVGKRVRSETGLSEGAVSVSFAAVSLARKIFGSLRDLNVLVVGAGEMAKLTATHLQAQDVRRVAIASRTATHAEALASAIGGLAIEWDRVWDELAGSDIVITATGSAAPILGRTQIDEAMRARGRRALFLIDIAVPRDVEPAAGEIDQVFLYNIDDLQGIVSENLARRWAEVARAETILDTEVEQFDTWLRSRRAIPTVVALRHHFEAIRRSELERLQPRLTKLPPDARARIDEVTRLIVEKLLLTPTERLKTIADQETVTAYSDALNRLFSLAAETAEEDGDGPDRDRPARKTPVAP